VTNADSNPVAKGKGEVVRIKLGVNIYFQGLTGEIIGKE
jgi:hypothetical protein